MVVLARLLPPGGVRDDMTILSEEWFDCLEDPRVTYGALHHAAAIEHLVPERGRFLGSIPALIGRVLLEDPLDICAERCDLLSGEYAVENHIPIRLELLHRSGDRVGSKSQIAG
jgi:hypothetical protein